VSSKKAAKLMEPQSPEGPEGLEGLESPASSEGPDWVPEESESLERPVAFPAVFGDHFGLTENHLSLLPKLWINPTQVEGRNKMAGFIDRYITKLVESQPSHNKDSTYLQRLKETGFNGHAFIAVYILCAEEFKEPKKIQVCFKESIRPLVDPPAASESFLDFLIEPISAGVEAGALLS